MQHKETLQRCLNSIGTFTEDEVAQILAHCSFRSVRKNEHLLQQGAICNSISFILRGACYAYQNTDEIIELYTEYDCIVNATSFFSQQASAETISAYTDCEILTLSIYDLHTLIGKSPAFFQLGRVLQAPWFRMHFFDRA